MRSTQKQAGRAQAVEGYGGLVEGYGGFLEGLWRVEKGAQPVSHALLDTSRGGLLSKKEKSLVFSRLLHPLLFGLHATHAVQRPDGQLETLCWGQSALYLTASGKIPLTIVTTYKSGSRKRMAAMMKITTSNRIKLGSM